MRFLVCTITLLGVVRKSFPFSAHQVLQPTGFSLGVLAFFLEKICSSSDVQSDSVTVCLLVAPLTPVGVLFILFLVP